VFAEFTSGEWLINWKVFGRSNRDMSRNFRGGNEEKPRKRSGKNG